MVDYESKLKEIIAKKNVKRGEAVDFLVSLASADTRSPLDYESLVSTYKSIMELNVMYDLYDKLFGLPKHLVKEHEERALILAKMDELFVTCLKEGQ